MDKFYQRIIIFALVVVLVFLLYQLFSPSKEEQIKNYLLDMGYQEDMYDRTLLIRNESATTTYYFSVADYTFSQKVDDYNTNVESMLNQTYDFKNQDLYYNYRVEYSDKINVIFKGDYNSGTFSCNKEFSTATLEQEEINNTCNMLRLKVERFYNESQTLFNNYHFIEYMENLKIE